MKLACISLVLILGLASLAIAGSVYGSISDAGKPVPQGVKIEIACGANKYAGETDANGGFKIFVPDKGKCTLKVAYQGQSPSVDISSYEGSVQYDLSIEKQNGQFTLKRK